MTTTKTEQCKTCGAVKGEVHQQEGHTHKIVTLHNVTDVDGEKRIVCMLCRDGIRALRAEMRNTGTSSLLKRPRKRPPVRLFVSGLVPVNGADTYDGIRLSVHYTKLDAFKDLRDWLSDDDGYELPDNPTVEQITAALNACEEIESWNVEEQTLYA